MTPGSEQARFLHRDIVHGYTTHKGSAAFGEPEALAEPEQARMSKQARQRFEEEQAEKIARRTALAWLRRLASIEQTAIDCGFDCSAAQARIRGEIQRFEQEVNARLGRRNRAAA